jgi:prepilin-type N-terminal cleavage/methylation domain-containing protein
MRTKITVCEVKISKCADLEAFTLVELLVVITIIAILAALLLPALASSKMQAQQTACLNPIKQITFAGLLYMSDTAQGLPLNNPGFVNYDPNAADLWMYAIAFYGAPSNMLFCPSTLAPPLLPPNQGAAGTANLPWTALGPVSSSFGFNGYLYKLITPSSLNLPTSKLSVMFLKPSSVQKPSETPIFFDENCMDTLPMESDLAAPDLYLGQSPPWLAGPARGIGCCTILRHGGRTATGSVSYKSGNPIPGAINMSFDDGHGELVKLQNLWTYTWHLNWNPAAVKGP